MDDKEVVLGFELQGERGCEAGGQKRRSTAPKTRGSMGAALILLTSGAIVPTWKGREGRSDGFAGQQQ